MAKKLKEAGYPQVANISHWIEYCDDPKGDHEKVIYFQYGSSRDGTCGVTMNGVTHLNSFAAPTFEEIRSKLPSSLQCDEDVCQLRICFPPSLGNFIAYERHGEGIVGLEVCKHNGEQLAFHDRESLANASASCYCYLADNNLLLKYD